MRPGHIRRSRGPWALALLALVSLAKAGAQVPAEDGFSLVYQAPASCPNQAQFRARLRARLRDPGTARAAVEIEVSLRTDARGALGRLRMRQGGGARLERSLAARTCAEASDALALVAALMLELGPVAADPPDPAPRARVPAELPPDPAAASVKGPSAEATEAGSVESSLARGTEGLDGDPKPRAAAVQVPSERPAAPAPVPAPAAGAPDASGQQALPRKDARSPALQWALHVAGGAVSGVAPHVRPSISLGTTLAIPVGPGTQLEIGLGLRGALPEELRVEPGTVRFAWLSSVSALCLRGPATRFWVSGCATLEAGALLAKGAASATGHERARFWGALGPRLGAGVELTQRLGLRLSGELLAVLVRDRFFLADQLVFSVPRLTFRAELGLSISIP